MKLPFFFQCFLVACTQLYKPLCWSVGLLVGPSVGRCSQSTVLMAIGLVSFYGCYLFPLNCTTDLQLISLNFALDLATLIMWYKTDQQMDRKTNGWTD